MQCISNAGVLTDSGNDLDHVGVAQENQSTISVVVGERTKRLGPQGDLRVHFARRLEREGHERTTGVGSVDAAHAVDRNLFYQQLLGHHGLDGLYLVGVLSRDVVLFHDYDSTPSSPH